MSPFLHGEAELAHAAGVQVKTLQRARIRQLKQGVDWDLNGMRVAYSKNGIAAVLEKISGQPPSPDELSTLEGKTLLADSGRNGSAETEPPIIARVFKFFPNPHLLQIELPDRTLAHLRVKHTVNFKRAMEVPVRLTALAGVYELTRREPRFPGRW